MNDRTRPGGRQAPAHPCATDGGIVVGSDGTWHSATALRRAACEAVERRLPLTVLTVVSTTHDSRLTAAAQRSAQASRLERATLAARATAERLAEEEPRLVVHVEVLLDGDHQALARALAGCRLLVVGDRGEVGRRAFLIGSTSRDLLRSVRCPVLVLPEPDRVVGVPQQARRSAVRGVLVGVDGTPKDAEVILTAGDEAVRRGTWLQVLHSTGAHELREPLDGAAGRVDELVRRAGLPGTLHVTTLLTPDPPAEALLARARDAGLLVVGTRGPLALARLALGSVSREVLDDAEGPVLVVPRTHATGPA